MNGLRMETYSYGCLGDLKPIRLGPFITLNFRLSKVKPIGDMFHLGTQKFQSALAASFLNISRI